MKQSTNCTAIWETATMIKAIPYTIRRLRITIDTNSEYLNWCGNLDELIAMFGTESWYQITADGWLVRPAFDRHTIIRAEWRDK